jgi:addiction module HigA family antidote
LHRLSQGGLCSEGIVSETGEVAMLHPGLFLKSEILRQHRIGDGEIAKLARELDYSFAGLSKVLNGQRRMTFRLALRLEEHFGYSADEFMNMQFRCDMERARGRLKGDALSGL